MNLFALCFCFKASEGTTQFILDLELPKHLFICSYAVALDVITVIETIQKNLYPFIILNGILSTPIEY